MYVARHNANFAFARRDDARTVRADQTGAAAFQIIERLYHIKRRYAFGYAHGQRQFGVRCLHHRIGCKRWRHIDYAGIRASGFHGIFDSIENRYAFMCRPALAWGDACDDVCAVGNHLFGMKGTFFASDALHNHASIFINKYAQLILLIEAPHKSDRYFLKDEHYNTGMKTL
jgi:hypothetical protein